MKEIRLARRSGTAGLHDLAGARCHGPGPCAAECPPRCAVGRAVPRGWTAMAGGNLSWSVRKAAGRA